MEDVAKRKIEWDSGEGSGDMGWWGLSSWPPSQGQEEPHPREAHAAQDSDLQSVVACPGIVGQGIACSLHRRPFTMWHWWPASVKLTQATVLHLALLAPLLLISQR